MSFSAPNKGRQPRPVLVPGISYYHALHGRIVTATQTMVAASDGLPLRNPGSSLLCSEDAVTADIVIAPATRAAPISSLLTEQ